MEELPVELQLQIMSYVSFSDRMRVRSTSRTFRALVPPPVIEWKDLVGKRVIGIGNAVIPCEPLTWDGPRPCVFPLKILAPPRSQLSPYKSRRYAGTKQMFYFLIQEPGSQLRSLVFVISDVWKGNREESHREKSGNWRLKEVDERRFPRLLNTISEKVQGLVSLTPTDWSFHDINPEMREWECEEETCGWYSRSLTKWYISIELETQSIRLGTQNKNTIWKRVNKG